MRRKLPAWIRRGILLLSKGASATAGQTVAGVDAEAAAPTVNPIRVAGWDGTSLRTLRTDQGGALAISGTTTASDGAKTAGLGVGLQGAATQSFPLAVGTMFSDGAALKYGRTPGVFKDIPSTAVVAGTGIIVWTPAAGKKFRVMGYALSLSVAGSIILCDHVVTTVLHRTPTLLAATPFIPPPLGNGQQSATANNVLRLDVTAGGNVAGFVFGTEE